MTDALKLAGASTSGFVLAAWHALDLLATSAGGRTQAPADAIERLRELRAALQVVLGGVGAAKAKLALLPGDAATLAALHLAAERLQTMAAALGERLGERVNPDAPLRTTWEQAREAALAAVRDVIRP